MSSRGGFLEGLIVGAILGGLTILVAEPSSREKLSNKMKKIRDDNEDVFESTEDLITKTKQSIESGFEKLGDIIKDNQKINAEDVLNPSNNK